MNHITFNLKSESNLLKSIEEHIHEKGNETAVRFLPRGEAEGAQEWTYAELDRRIRTVAAYLHETKATGKAVLLAYPPGLEFIAALLGCFRAGAIAVPAHSPTAGSKRTERFLAIGIDCDAQLALTDNKTLQDVIERRESESDRFWGKLHWISTENLPENYDSKLCFHSAIAFLQYTSGSTGKPRGVMVSHDNLTANIRQILHQIFQEHSHHHIISWLPQYHDMGLIGAILAPLYCGFPVTFFPPLEFVKKPVRWLKAISHYRGTVTTAPTFGYDLAARNAKPEDLTPVDLSSLEAAVCGAEPVRADVLERFMATFAPCGLRPDVFHPSYGLAESTLLVSSAGGPLSSSIRSFSTSALRENWALPHNDSEDDMALNAGTVAPDAATQLVACGRVADSNHLRIVDPETGYPCPAGKIGEIWLTGSSVARGYFRHREDSSALFDARLANTGEGPWLRTGDLGFVLQGQLYITGRHKNLIVIQGRNYYPQDLETLAETLPGIIPHGTAAFGILDSHQAERAVLVAEFDQRSGQDPQATVEAVYRTLAEHLELELSCVLLVKRNQIPRTTSGKIQHRACREAFLDGKLPEIARRNALTELSSANQSGQSNSEIPQTSAVLYSNRDSHLNPFEKLDRRSLKYRFDEERDICWDRIGEGGYFFSDDYFQKFGVDVEALNANPQAREIFDWCAALSVCISFDVFETGLIYFFQTHAGEGENTKSAEYLIDEEEKHVRVFRRFARHLENQYSDRLSRARQLCEETADFIISLSLDAQGNDEILLQFLFLETCSVYLHRILSSSAAQIQPTWLSLHGTHSREEGQHLVTNAAYLTAQGSSPEERGQASFQLMKRLKKGLLHIFNLYAPLKLIGELFPDLKVVRADPSELFNISLKEMFSEACFRPFREAVPDLENIWSQVAENDRPTQSEILNNQANGFRPHHSPQPLGKKTDLIFLLSAPRCGSTLMRTMLSAHQQLFCPPELNLLSFTNLEERESRLKFGQGDGLAQALAELDHLEAESAIALAENWIKNNHSTGKVYQELLKRTQARNLILLDKSPHYAHDLKILQKAEELFDGRVQYIHLLRHPYPAVLSFVRLGMERLYRTSEQGDISAAELGEYTWTIYNRNILEFLEKIDRSRHCRVYYEDLMQNPESQLRELCQFMELDFTADMLQPYEKGTMWQPLRAESLTGDPNFLQKTKLDSSRGEAWRSARLPHKPSLSLQRIAARVGYELPEESPISETIKDSNLLPSEMVKISPVSHRQQEIQQIVQRIVADRLQMNPETIPIDRPFTSLGLASVTLMRLVVNLEEELGSSLGAMTFFDFPTIESLAQHLATEYPESKRVKISDTKTQRYQKDPNPNLHPEATQVYETYLQKYLEQKTNPVKFSENPLSVVLTGATGFLGAHLLADFLELTGAEILCPVRAKSDRSAYERIYQNLEQYNLWQERYADRIVAIPGDLSQAHLGTSLENYQRMAAADLICHNAAQVDFLASYEQLKPANVIGTCEILKLAVSGQTKPLHYISSGAVFGTCLNGSIRRVFEDERLERCEGLFLGYMQSKWVAEKIVLRASENHGMPISVYRPAIIGVHTINQTFSSVEFFYRLLQTCLTLKAYPDLPDVWVDASPVDYVSRAVVSLSLHRQSNGRAFHLNHPQPVSFNTLIETGISQTGCLLQKMPYLDWLDLLRNKDMESELGGLKMLFDPLWEGDRNLLDFRRQRPQIDSSQTQDFLEKIGLVCPSWTHSKWLNNWFEIAQ